MNTLIKKMMVVSAGLSSYVYVLCAHLRSAWIQKLKMNDDEIYPVALKSTTTTTTTMNTSLLSSLFKYGARTHTFTFTCAQYGWQFKERREKHNKIKRIRTNAKWKRNKNKRMYSSFHARSHVVFFAFTFFETFFFGLYGFNGLTESYNNSARAEPERRRRGKKRKKKQQQQIRPKQWCHTYFFFSQCKRKERHVLNLCVNTLQRWVWKWSLVDEEAKGEKGKQKFGLNGMIGE